MSEQPEKILRDFIIATYNVPPSSLSDDLNIIESGVVDSAGIIELSAFVEEAFGITIQDEDISEDNFGSIKSMADYIKRKRG